MPDTSEGRISYQYAAFFRIRGDIQHRSYDTHCWPSSFLGLRKIQSSSYCERLGRRPTQRKLDNLGFHQRPGFIYEATKMFITWSSDYIYVLAMLKTTPVVVTIGLSLTIPLAVIGDTLINVSTSGQAIVGACLVLLSFVILGLDSAKSRLSNNNALRP